MELTDSTSGELKNPPPPPPPINLTDSSRSGIGIDLNEIPSPSSFSETLSDTFDVVRTHYDKPPRPPGDPADVPGDVCDSVCGTCGQSEARGHVVVCDGCERGFHLACAGMRGGHAVISEDWVCGECLCGGVKSKRWPLGVKSKQLLDINASPPSDGDPDGDDGGGELAGFRKHTAEDNSSHGTPFGSSVKYRNLLYSGNGFGLQKASDIVKNTVKMGFEDILQHAQIMGGSLEVDLSCPLGSCRSSRGTSIKLPPQNTSEIFLQALRDFVSERHGILEEGWRVEFKQSVGSYELHATYCAPDGKTFGSVYEVACHLGLIGSMQTRVRRQGSLQFSGKSYLPKRRKLNKSLVANGFTDNNGSLIYDQSKQFSCDRRSLSGITIVNLENSGEAVVEENGVSISSQCYEGFPLQFEDFFVLSLGEIDARPTYHDVSQVYPIGFRSCWHDKVTGSLFIYEVLDGGDSGPLFKVRRCPCSAFPIPVGSTILSWQKTGHFAGERIEGNDLINYGSEENLDMILSDPCPPMEDDILSCLGSYSNGACNVQMPNGSHHEASSVSGKPEGLLSDYLYLRDEIGEISVEDTSSSSAWKKMTQNLVKACSELCNQKSTVKFCCDHVGNEQSLISHYRIIGISELYSGLDKFCGFPSSTFIPSGAEAENELYSFPDELEKWLDQDRFGLDMEFVQEILEKIPHIQSCSRYQFVNKRSDCSTLPTVGNGVLEVKKFDGEECKEDGPLNFLFRRSKKSKLVGDNNFKDKHPPPGKLLCLHIPLELIGDVYQVWDFLSRFHQNLGLKEALSLEELEEDLFNRQGDGTNTLQKSEGKSENNQLFNSHITDFASGQISSIFEASGDPHAFIQMETRVMKEASEGKLASSTDNRYMGVALTKAHTSLLRVLITELQSKVAAFVDPNFDSGESKPKRGRKKDVDSANPSKKMKLNLLPLNELTWPELARRYILAVLSMDGNLDSAEVTARESGRVFRCLQGDGGVLCGSLTGVAGMEADAFMLAEATKHIFGFLTRQKDVITLEEEASDTTVGCEKVLVSDGNLPEWAQVLEPVKKLPTNVGTRIRKCVYEALERNPPEWAKKILEHSISKEVYKGNASGPTKKAVISLLADICGESVPQKAEQRRKRTISISDIIMKQCRIVLRDAAAADDGKIFCNLLGRKLMTSSDNDDEGLLGPPAMVSRPLDFRTIDLRLAAGSYGGSYEAFLEDVRELWNNLRYAYSDQSDLVELVETLSRNFETLYENKVMTLVQKLHEFSKLECSSAEIKREVDSFLVSSSAIPKAPWDEGVCKVCGIDKDDDSVLLCDKCDAEYHTYCLNPPLARIPEGNWYCPSCVIGTHMVEDPSAYTQNHIFNLRKGKKFRGEVTRDFLDTLTNLAVALEEKDYWEFSVDKRLFLLRYLCDELLSSALIRQHLEQCVETSTELQQKLRSCFVEWKNLKSREEVVTARAAKLDTTMLSAVRDGQGGCDGTVLGAPDQYSSLTSLENKFHNPVGIQERMNDAHDDLDNNDVAGNLQSNSGSQNSDKPLKLNESPLSSSLPQEVDMSDQSNMEIEISTVPSTEQPCNPSDAIGVSADAHVPPLNESPAYHIELNNIKKDISLLQDSMANIELELLKVSVRREFLGSDSAGRLYWATVMSNGQPQIIACGSLLVQIGSEITDGVVKGPVLKNYTSSSISNFPFFYHPKDSISNSPWVSYQTETEIRELIDWLKDNDSKERELKESILLWHKPRLQASLRYNNQSPDEQLRDSSASKDVEKLECSSRLVTKAFTVLESRYGPCLDLETSDILKRCIKKTRLADNEKMFRCVCLEPVWPSRQHCLSCHKSFLTDVELEGHDDGKCNVGPTCDGVKETGDSLNSKGNLKCETNREESLNMTLAETSKGGGFNSSMGSLKFQRDGMMCPYDFELICSKFLTMDSNKDAIQEIGLISSNGILSFLPSVSPYVMESTLTSIHLIKDSGALADMSLPADSLGNTCADSQQKFSVDNPIRRPAVNETSEVMKTKRLALGCPEPKNKKFSLDNRFSELGIGKCRLIPQSSLRPLVGRTLHVIRGLKMNLIDMEAALPEEARRPSKLHVERRWAWRAFVKSAGTIFEMVQATIVFEDMIRTEYLKNEWWYWSSLSAAAKISKASSLALRIFSLDAAIMYEKILSNSNPNDYLDSDQKLAGFDLTEKPKACRKSNKKRKEPEG